MAELSLVVGVATWKGNALPVVPVSVTIEDDGLSTTIRFTGRVALNVAFVNTLREQGVFLDEDSLFDGASYDSGTPETSAMFARISSEASERISDFAIERQIVLGCFMDPSSQMISESRQFIDQLENGPTGNVLLDALAGDESARTALKDAEYSAIQSFRRRPACRVRSRRCGQYGAICRVTCCQWP